MTGGAKLLEADGAAGRRRVETMLRVLQQTTQVLHVEATGQLDARDYHRVLPALERGLAGGRSLGLVIELRDFQGPSPAWILHEPRFRLDCPAGLARIAVVGPRRWEHWAPALTAPIAGVAPRFFRRHHLQAALSWAGNSTQGAAA